MSDLVTVTRDGDVGVVTIDNPPVNALSPGVLDGLIAALRTLRADDAVKGIVLNGSGKIFCGGADINEFGKLTSGKKSLDVGFGVLLSELEDSPKPVVCALHGTAFGGGLEMAMACHYRVATPDAQVGQPEVKIGLIPGAGGTQRLPRLAGVAKAAEMCAGDEADLDLRLADLRVRRRDAVVARHRHLQPAAECGAVDGADDRLGVVFQFGE